MTAKQCDLRYVHVGVNNHADLLGSVGETGGVMNKLLLASLAFVAVGMTAPAKAADMPVKYVAPAPVFTWTGCYVGAHVGYKWGTSKQESGGLYGGCRIRWYPRAPT